MASKAWGGRFGDKTDRRVEQFTESISFDRRLFEQDIRVSIAHAQMLATVGLITHDECTQIVRGLTEIKADIEADRFEFVLEREDVHMHIEAALIEKLGDVGRKLHTARSRNDQVATDTKLWVRDGLDRIDSRLLTFQRALVAAADRHRDVILPGYTHMQRAQPVLAPHYFLAYVEKLQRDRGRLADARKRLNVLPLGAAALAGSIGLRTSLRMKSVRICVCPVVGARRVFGCSEFRPCLRAGFCTASVVCGIACGDIIVTERPKNASR